MNNTKKSINELVEKSELTFALFPFEHAPDFFKDLISKSAVSDIPTDAFRIMSIVESLTDEAAVCRVIPFFAIVHDNGECILGVFDGAIARRIGHMQNLDELVANFSVDIVNQDISSIDDDIFLFENHSFDDARITVDIPKDCDQTFLRITGAEDISSAIEEVLSLASYSISGISITSTVNTTLQ